MQQLEAVTPKFSTLVKDLQRLILAYLATGQLLRLRLVSREWKEASERWIASIIRERLGLGPKASFEECLLQLNFFSDCENHAIITPIVFRDAFLTSQTYVWTWQELQSIHFMAPIDRFDRFIMPRIFRALEPNQLAYLRNRVIQAGDWVSDGEVVAVCEGLISSVDVRCDVLNVMRQEQANRHFAVYRPVHVEPIRTRTYSDKKQLLLGPKGLAALRGGLISFSDAMAMSLKDLQNVILKQQTFLNIGSAVAFTWERSLFQNNKEKQADSDESNSEQESAAVSSSAEAVGENQITVSLMLHPNQRVFNGDTLVQKKHALPARADYEGVVTVNDTTNDPEFHEEVLSDTWNALSVAVTGKDFVSDSNWRRAVVPSVPAVVSAAKPLNVNNNNNISATPAAAKLQVTVCLKFSTDINDGGVTLIGFKIADKALRDDLFEKLRSMSFEIRKEEEGFCIFVNKKTRAHPDHQDEDSKAIHRGYTLLQALKILREFFHQSYENKQAFNLTLEPLTSNQYIEDLRDNAVAIFMGQKFDCRKDYKGLVTEDKDGNPEFHEDKLHESWGLLSGTVPNSPSSVANSNSASVSARQQARAEIIARKRAEAAEFDQQKQLLEGFARQHELQRQYESDRRTAVDAAEREKQAEEAARQREAEEIEEERKAAALQRQADLEAEFKRQQQAERKEQGPKRAAVTTSRAEHIRAHGLFSSRNSQAVLGVAMMTTSVLGGAALAAAVMKGMVTLTVLTSITTAGVGVAALLLLALFVWGLQKLMSNTCCGSSNRNSLPVRLAKIN